MRDRHSRCDPRPGSWAAGRCSPRERGLGVCERARRRNRQARGRHDLHSVPRWHPDPPRGERDGDRGALRYPAARGAAPLLVGVRRRWESLGHLAAGSPASLHARVRPQDGAPVRPARGAAIQVRSRRDRRDDAGRTALRRAAREGREPVRSGRDLRRERAHDARCGVFSSAPVGVVRGCGGGRGPVPRHPGREDVRRCQLGHPPGGGVVLRGALLGSGDDEGARRGRRGGARRHRERGNVLLCRPVPHRRPSRDPRSRRVGRRGCRRSGSREGRGGRNGRNGRSGASPGSPASGRGDRGPLRRRRHLRRRRRGDGHGGGGAEHRDAQPDRPDRGADERPAHGHQQAAAAGEGPSRRGQVAGGEPGPRGLGAQLHRAGPGAVPGGDPPEEGDRGAEARHLRCGEGGSPQGPGPKDRGLQEGDGEGLLRLRHPAGRLRQPRHEEGRRQRELGHPALHGRAERPRGERYLHELHLRADREHVPPVPLLPGRGGCSSTCNTSCSP